MLTNLSNLAVYGEASRYDERKYKIVINASPFL